MRHVWRKSHVKGRTLPDYCERCGRDKPADPVAAARLDCRPTRL